MIFPIIELASLFFIIPLIIFLILECVLFYEDEPKLIICIFVSFATATLIFVDYKVTWHYFAIYLVGAVIWTPIFWYLTLLHNKQGLLLSKYDSIRGEYGELSGDMWLPFHPTTEMVIANALLWFIAAPLRIFDRSIRKAIQLLNSLMEKIRRSMGVKI